MMHVLDAIFGHARAIFALQLGIASTLAALMLFFSWWRDRGPLRCEAVSQVVFRRCRSAKGHGGRHCADLGDRLVFWGPF